MSGPRLKRSLSVPLSVGQRMMQSSEYMASSSEDWPSSGRSCFEFRIGIEGEAAATAARKRTSSDLRDLQELMARLNDLTPGIEVGLEEDFEFHLAVARASHNDYFVSALLSLREEIFRGMLLARTSAGVDPGEKIGAINSQHALIYNAVFSGDAEAARTMMRSHLLRCKMSTSHWDLADVV